MANEKIFFSYSRTDSTFVLKLAKDLRDSGIDLWLDQLDIKAGSHWDSSIQDALTTTHILIVVLSKASVKSENVMDEVSFALETNKTIIPVLFNECVPPFRLMRLQRLDFTGDYQTGLTQLLETLNQTFKSREGMESNAGQVKPGSADDGSTADPDPNPKRSDAESQVKDKELERLLWEKAKKENSLSAYNHYVSEYPNGINKDVALAEIAKLKMGEQQPGSSIPSKNTYPAGENLPKSNTKKYLIFAGVLALLALGIWGVMRSSGQSGETNAATGNSMTDAKRVEDSIRVNDSIAKAVKTEQSKARKDSIKLGSYFEGGIIYYIDQTGEHGLIMAQGDQSEKMKWSDKPFMHTGAYGPEIYDGADNTNIIVSKLGDGNYPAKICADLDLKGYTDWYLPSKSELIAMYDYNKIHKGFTDDYYWSSTEIAETNVYYQSFFNGRAYTKIESNRGKVRAIRKF